MGGIKNPYVSAVLYGTGSAETPENIPEEIIYNALGNKYAQKVPITYLFQPYGKVAQEYLSRKIPELIKYYGNK